MFRPGFVCLVSLSTAITLASNISVLAAEDVSETWDVAYIGETKVGYIHTTVDRRESDGRLVIHVRQLWQMTITRFSDTMKVGIAIDSFELENGHLYAVDLVLKMANSAQQSRGRLNSDGKFEVTTRTPGKEQTEILDWPDDVLGPYANERLLRDQSIKPGQTRTFRCYLPELVMVSAVSLKAVGWEETALRGGKKRELLHVEQRIEKVPGIVIGLWLDKEGTVVKGEVPYAGSPITMYRGSREEALQEPANQSVDLGYETLVHVAKPIPNATATHAVTYRLRMSDEQAADTVPESTYQKIIRRQGNTVWLKVSRVVPPAERAKGDAPAPEFLEPNGFIQSDDPLIVAAARQIVGQESDPWKKACRLERWVDQNMVNRDFNIGFATASEIIRTRQGDCTEHGVLLAALCRAANIPARVAMGLVYLSGTQSFGYHMWTEVNIGGTWYALDGTLGQGFVAGGHIKLADSSLKGASAMSMFLPVYQIMVKLEIDIEDIE